MKTLATLAGVLLMLWIIVSRLALIVLGVLATLWFVGAILDTFRSDHQAKRVAAA